MTKLNAFSTHLADLADKPTAVFLKGYREAKRKRMGRQVNFVNPDSVALRAPLDPYWVLKAVSTLLDGGFYPVPPDLLRNIVLTAFGVGLKDFVSSRRQPYVVACRHCYMWFARKHTNLSFTAMSRFVGDRDHSSILYGVNKFERIQDQYHKQITAIRAEIERI